MVGTIEFTSSAANMRPDVQLVADSSCCQRHALGLLLLFRLAFAHNLLLDSLPVLIRLSLLLLLLLCLDLDCARPFLHRLTFFTIQHFFVCLNFLFRFHHPSSTFVTPSCRTIRRCLHIRGLCPYLRTVLLRVCFAIEQS